MPIVRVQIPFGYPDKLKTAISEDIRDAIDRIIDPGQGGRHPETCKWIYVAVNESHGSLGRGLPTVSIDTRPGRTTQQKMALANAICDIFDDHMKTRDVYVLFRISEAEDHICGGEPLPEWRPPAA